MNLVFENNRWYVEGPKGKTSLSVYMEYIIEHNLKMGNNFGSIMNDAGHFVVVSTDEQNDAREPFNTHFNFRIEINPSTKEPSLIIFSVKNRELVDKLIPIFVSHFGGNNVYDLDMEFSLDTVQQIFEKR